MEVLQKNKNLKLFWRLTFKFKKFPHCLRSYLKLSEYLLKSVEIRIKES